MATYKKPCIHCNNMVSGDARLCPFCGSGSPFCYLCPTCLKEIGAGHNICEGCGRPLYVPCPSCGKLTFAAEQLCGVCGASLMVLCQNRRCGQMQFFQNAKCTACGKKMKK